MKKRLIALVLALVLAFSCLIVPSYAGETSSRLDEARKASVTKYTHGPLQNTYVFPYASSYYPSVVKGGSFLLQFKRNRQTPRADDIFFLEVYHCTDNQLLDMSYDAELVDVWEYDISKFDNSQQAIAITWTADSYYTTGNYSYLCGVCSASGEVYEQTICHSDMYVVSAAIPVTGIYYGEQSSSLLVGNMTSFGLLPEPFNATTPRTMTAVSGNPDILTAIVDAGYLFLFGNAVGQTTLTIQCGNVKKVLNYTVNGLDYFTAASGKDSLCVGQTDQIVTTATPDVPVFYTWTSDHPEVATVKDGVVTAVSPGTAAITVSVLGMSKKLSYTVHYHELPEDTPITGPTATQPKQAVGHCSICGQDDAANIFEPAIFTDTNAKSWYAEHVDKVYDLKLMNGTGEHTFAPNANVNRAMAATVLWRIAGEPEVEGESPFNDVPENKYYTNAVIWAQKNGVVNGYPDGTFRPNDNITREQLAAILYRYASAQGKAKAEAADLNDFPDAASVHAYAKDALAWAVGAGLINGVGSGGKSYLQPASNATRAQFATIISRYMSTVDPIVPDAPEPTPDTPADPPQKENDD